MDTGKLATVLLIAAIVSSLIMVKSLSVSALTSKPSTPEFTVQFVSHPYDVPPSYTIDSYTGENITWAGYHVENKSTEIVIKNQPFTSRSINGSKLNLYYQVRYKGHFEEDNWHYMFSYPTDYPMQSNSEYTILTVSNFHSSNGYALSNRAKIDIQVQAKLGHIEFVNGRIIGAYDFHVFVGESSDWSSTQTINLDESAAITTPTVSPSQSTPNPTASTMPSENPEVTPTQPITQTGLLVGFDWEKTVLAVLALAVAILAVAVVVLWRKVTIKIK